MLREAVVEKIENDLVYLKFNDNNTRRYFMDNFIKEPFIGQRVEILETGIIIEKKGKPYSTKRGKANKLPFLIKILICVLIIVVFLYFLAIFLFMIMCKTCVGG